MLEITTWNAGEEGHLLVVDFDKNDKVVSELVHNGFDQEQLGELMLRNKESKEFLTVTVFQIEFIRSE